VTKNKYWIVSNLILCSDSTAIKILLMTNRFLRPIQSIKEGFLTVNEVNELQKISNRYKTSFYVVGSRAKGAGRNINWSHLPVGKGLGTRSDIDVRIDGQADILSGGRLSHDIANVSGGIGKCIVLIGNEAEPPAIIFSPQ
jgi:hypothetical protein